MTALTLTFTDTHRRWGKRVGYPLFGLVATVFALHYTFPYHRLEQRFSDTLGEYYDVDDDLEISPGWIPGHVIVKNVNLKTRPQRETDKPIGALLTELKERDLLKDTIVIWGGEFGRTPMNEARGGSKLLGRDHHPRTFSVWLAGGGVKPGVTVGETDEIGYNPVVDPVSVHDLHATLLHLMGIDHTRLTYKFQGREFRLTDVEGVVVKKLLA